MTSQHTRPEPKIKKAQDIEFDTGVRWNYDYSLKFNFMNVFSFTVIKLFCQLPDYTKMKTAIEDSFTFRSFFGGNS